MTFCFAFGTDGAIFCRRPQPPAGSTQLSPWVSIAPDGAITILTVTEMGQGSGTSIPLMIAEEMDADWSKVKLAWAPSDTDTYGWPDRNGGRNMSISGSRAVMMYWNDLRTAGAQVRKVLIANAAEKWGVDAKTLKTEPSVVLNPANGQRLSYGEIAAFGKVPDTLPRVEKSELKPARQFRLIGKSVPRRDLPLKVNGSAQYAIDIHLPGMAYATALHSPAAGNAPESWNDDADQSDAGRHRDGQIARRHCRGRRHVPAGDGGAARAQGELEQRQDRQLQFRPGAGRLFEAAGKPRAPVKTCSAKGDVKAAFAGAAKTYAPNSAATTATTRRWSR